MKKDCLFEVAAGTYEEFLVCYKFKKEDGSYKLEQSVANHSHKASLRAVASSKTLLVSAGADETVQVYDMLERKERGILSHHNGTVTCVGFSPDGNYLMTGSEDGSLALVRVGPWKVHKLWSNAHKGQGVNDFAIHPSGKLALSVGKDKMIRTWNLMTGRRAFTVSLGKRCGTLECVKFSPKGTYYVIPYGNKVDVYEMKTAAVSHVIEVPSKVTSIAFIQEDVMAVGEAEGDLSGHSCSTGGELWRVKTGDERVKCLASHEGFLAVGTSQGKLMVYDSTKSPPEIVTTADSKCRLTCMTISTPFSDIENKKAKKEKGKVKIETDEPVTKKMKTSKGSGQTSTDEEETVQLSAGGQKWLVENVD